MPLGAGEPCNQHTPHPQQARNTIFSCSSSSASTHGAGHSWVMSTCEGFKNCPGSSFLNWIWCALEVIWLLDDTNFNFSSVLHLLWHKKSRCWYFHNNKHLCKQLLKDPNDFGSQFEKWQDDQWLKFSRTEEDNAVLNNTGHSSSCKCDPSTLPQSTQLLKPTGT